MRNSAPLVEQPRDDSIPSVYRFQGRFFVVKYSVFLFFAITPPPAQKTGKTGKTGNSFRIGAFALYSERTPPALSIEIPTARIAQESPKSVFHVQLARKAVEASEGNLERFLIFSAFLKNHDRKKNTRRDCGKPCFWAFQAKPENVGRLWETCFWFSIGFPWSSNPGA